MPHFESIQTFPKPIAEVFDFFRQPASLVRVTPPDLHMKVIEGPDRIELGARVVLQGRRWGIPQRIVSEITTYEPNGCFADTQREGPFKHWVHTHRFEEVDGGTRVTDRIDYEPPGGLLGLVMTAGLIDRELRAMFDHRRKVLEELLGKK